MDTDRTILHCDMNGFFASVEMLDHPELIDKPVAVSGDPDHRRGIILAKNEIAKRFGVSTGETIWQAKRKCPKLVLLQSRKGLYSKYSKLANQIYFSYTNKVEPFGIDESWLDVTASATLHGDGKTIADKIRARIKDELKLTVSVGVSFNKVFAKLASDYKKPDATTVFDRNTLESIVYNLPAASMLFVGRSTAAELHKMGISTIGDIAAFPEAPLVAKFGKHGSLMKKYALGLDDSPVADYGSHDPIKSIGNHITFKRDILTCDDLKKGFAIVAQKLSQRMHRKNIQARCIQITIKRSDFTVVNRQTRLKRPTNLSSDLAEAAYKCALTCVRDGAIRMLGISCCDLIAPDSPFQTDLFDKIDTKAVGRENAFFSIKEAFGESSIMFGSMLDNDLE